MWKNNYNSRNSTVKSVLARPIQSSVIVVVHRIDHNVLISDVLMYGVCLYFQRIVPFWCIS